MGFLSNLYNKIKKTIGKTTHRIKTGIGKAIHSITTFNNPSKQISTQQRQAIDFMKESYEPPSKRLKNLHGFNYQPQYSTQARAVYVNEGSRTVYYVIRGTETIMDGVNDLDILTGSEDKNARFQSDLRYYDYLGGEV